VVVPVQAYAVDVVLLTTRDASEQPVELAPPLLVEFSTRSVKPVGGTSIAPLEPPGAKVPFVVEIAETSSSLACASTPDVIEL
jgi:hypothetical protein